MAILLSEEVGSFPMESIQRTRGTRVRVRRRAMTVGLERKKGRGRTKGWK